MNEFPKMLYLNGDPEAEYRIVSDQAEEDDIRAEGFAMAGEEQAEAKPRRGRPPKAEANG